jgi:PmbA protein
MAGMSKATKLYIEAILESGIQKAQTELVVLKKTELNAESGNISLLRTTENVALSLTGITEGRKGSVSINKTDRNSIENSIVELAEMIDAGQADPANEIAEFQQPESFSKGSEEPDMELMYTRLNDFLQRSSSRYPNLLLEQVILDHTAEYRFFNNSNGVDFTSMRGAYNLMVMFTSKDGSNTSSFNYAAVSFSDLSEELYLAGGLDRLMEQSTEQTETQMIDGSFEGDVIITPECLGGFVHTLTGYLGDQSLVTQVSIYKDMLGEIIADERFCLHSRPVSDELAGGYFFTSEGFKAGNSTIINRGVLNTFLLSLYGSLKTGGTRAVNSGGYYVIDPGDTDLSDMVKSVKKGILLCRFSGGNPSSSGEFSGVAKNSYYIEDGEIKYPVSETMIAGKISDMLKSVKNISRETVNDGGSVFPWITFGGVTVSGK